jgi:hypothetical protein
MRKRIAKSFSAVVMGPGVRREDDEGVATSQNDDARFYFTRLNLTLFPSASRVAM